MLRCVSSCFVVSDAHFPEHKEKEKNAQGQPKEDPSRANRTLKKVHVSCDTSLHSSSSDSSPNTSSSSLTSQEDRSGFVLEKRGKKWKSAFLKLEGTYLLCTSANEPGSPCRMLPLNICMVRPMKKGKFTVMCATQYSISFKAKDVASMRDWVADIQSGIADALSAPASPSSSSGKEMLALLRKSVANRFCADCGSHDPTWVSVSIGVLVCIECSGVHRSLGSHISKVRSFDLDLWDEKTESVEKISNADLNFVFEAVIPTDIHKPLPSSDRESREKWIIAKYVHKKFIRKPPPVLSPVLRFRQASDLAKKLPPGFAISSLGRPRTPECTPTSHIGSNIFEKKMPYGIETYESVRRGSLPFLENAPYRVTARRNSMHPRIM